MQLFDDTPYVDPSVDPARSRQATSRYGTRQEDVVPLEEGWYVLTTNRHGVIPYHHRLAAPEAIQKAIKDGILVGAQLTECGEIGRVISDPGVSQMVPCPTCRASL